MVGYQFQTKSSIGGTNVPLTFNNAGNVGIGTTSPQQNLSVNGGVNLDQANVNKGTVDSALTFGSGSGEAIASKRTAGGNQFGLDFYTNFVNRMSITQGGNVGIGTASPQVKFHVVGNRIRLQKTNGHSLDMRTDGAAMDIESLDEDLYINNLSNTAVRIKNFINISSRELKENFSELSGKEAFETLENLNPLRFQYKGDTRGELHLGFIAEDVSRNVATVDRKGINPMAIIAVLTRVVKEQQKMILTLQESIGFAK